MGGAIYPSCVVNLRLRFDEAFRVVDLPEPGPQSGDPKAALLPAQTGRIDGSPNYMTGTRPLITQTGTDQLSYVQDRVPKSCQIELPSYRQAGKFTIELDWRELPIDPRLVRACGVEIYLGTVSADDFAAGMDHVEPNGRRRSVMRTTDEGGATRDDLMVLAGIADSWTTTHTGEEGKVKIEGRDLRGVFLDSPMDPDVLSKIDLKQSLDFVILDILKGHPAAAYMSIAYSPEDWPGGEPPAVLDKEGLTRVRRNADGQGASSGQQGGDKLSAWDVITRYCFLVGAIPYFRGRILVLRPAVSVFDQSKPKYSSQDKVFDPTTRYDDDGNPFTTRKMVMGRNIQELTFERKLSGTKVPVIEIVSFDTSSKVRGEGKLLVEQWPPADAQAALISGVHPSGEASQTDKLVIPVPGIRDRDKLLGIAKSIFEEVGRGELGGSCKTGQLASFKGGNSDPDLLRLRPGDVIEFMTDTRAVGLVAPGASTYIDAARLSFDEQVANVRKALSGKTDGGDENLARVLVASARSSVVDLLRSFRVANVVYNWSLAKGIQVSFDFQNYFVIRYGINDQLGKNVTAPVTKVLNSTVARRAKVHVVSKPVVAKQSPAKKIH